MRNKGANTCVSVSFWCIQNCPQIQWFKTVISSWFFRLTDCTRLSEEVPLLVLPGLMLLLAISWQVIWALTCISRLVTWLGNWAVCVPPAFNGVAWTSCGGWVLMAGNVRSHVRTQGLFEPFLLSYLKISHWPKPVIWPSVASRGEEIDSTPWWEVLQNIVAILKNI